MALYNVRYIRPGEEPQTHQQKAKSDYEAKMRFLNLSWVAFTEIVVIHVIVASGEGADDGAARPPGSARPAIKRRAAARVIPASGESPPTVTPGALTKQIDALAGKRAAATAAGDHRSAAALNVEINKLKRQRHELGRVAP